jgi:hypothetical protein
MRSVTTFVALFPPVAVAFVTSELTHGTKPLALPPSPSRSLQPTQSRAISHHLDRRRPTLATTPWVGGRGPWRARHSGRQPSVSRRGNRFLWSRRARRTLTVSSATSSTISRHGGARGDGRARRSRAFVAGTPARVSGSGATGRRTGTGKARSGTFLRADWWSRGGSNPRPLHCERSALPAELRPLGRGSGTVAAGILVSTGRS